MVELGINSDRAYLAGPEDVAALGDKLAALLLTNEKEWQYVHALEELLGFVRDGTLNLLLAPSLTAPRAYALLKVENLGPRRRVLVFTAGGYEIVRYTHAFVSAVKYFAETYAASRIDMCGAMAWRRLLEHHDFTPTAIRMTLFLGER